MSTGIITTIAGTGMSSFSGDNGPATSAALNEPEGIALDSAGSHILTSLFFFSIYNSSFCNLGNVYIGDENNHRIRKVTVSTGIITTFAGTGTGSYSGDGGAATSAGLYFPLGVALDSAGTHSLLLFGLSIFSFLIILI